MKYMMNAGNVYGDVDSRSGVNRLAWRGERFDG